MTDDIKELLTLAAKACGYELHWETKPDYAWFEDDNGQQAWAPHLDDGDGARMEAKLRLHIAWNNSIVAACRDDILYEREAYADHANNRQAARRWASLRAAAQVGRGML